MYIVKSIFHQIKIRFALTIEFCNLNNSKLSKTTVIILKYYNYKSLMQHMGRLNLVSFVTLKWMVKFFYVKLWVIPVCPGRVIYIYKCACQIKYYLTFTNVSFIIFVLINCNFVMLKFLASVLWIQEKSHFVTFTQVYAQL